MDISFSSMFFHDASLEDVFRAPSLCGADTLEFWLETPDFWLKGLEMDSLMKWMEAYPRISPLTVHAPVLDLNPCSINPDVREVSIWWIMRSINLAEMIGASVCTIHPGRRTAKRPPSMTDYLRLGHMLDCIADLAEEVSVRVAIENMEPAVNALLTAPDEVAKVLEDRPWLWFTFDVAHAIRSGPDIIGAFLEIGADRIGNIHLSGISGGKMHGLVSTDPDVAASLKRLSDLPYDGQMTLEFNDLVLPDTLSYKEKVTLMGQEIMWLRNAIGEA